MNSRTVDENLEGWSKKDLLSHWKHEDGSEIFYLEPGYKLKLSSGEVRFFDDLIAAMRHAYNKRKA